MSDNRDKLLELIRSMGEKKEFGVLWADLKTAALEAKLDPKELDEDLMALIDEGSVEEPKIGYLRIKVEKPQEPEAYIPSVEPRSVCTCKHNGDGVGSEHDADPVSNHAGLGPCKMAGCPCMGFTFDHFLEKYATRSGKPTPGSKKSVEETVKKLARAKRKKDLEAEGVIPPEKAPEAPAAPAPIQPPLPPEEMKKLGKVYGNMAEVEKTLAEAHRTLAQPALVLSTKPEVATPEPVPAPRASPALDSDIHTPAQADQAAGRIIDEAQNMTPKQMEAVKKFAPETTTGTLPPGTGLYLGKKRGRKPRIAGMDVKVVPDMPPNHAVIRPDKETIEVKDLGVIKDPELVSRAKELLAQAGYTVGTLKEKVYQVFDLNRDKDRIERSLKIKLANGQRLDIIIHKKRGSPVTIVYPNPGALDLKNATRFARGCLKATDLAEEMEMEVGD